MKNLKNILILLRLVSTREHPVYEGKQTRINPYNPLSYISLFLVLLFVFIKEGLTGLKEVNNPFKWIPYYKNDNADDFNDKKTSKFKKLLGVFIKTIDWKWVGISYVIFGLIIIFFALIENDWTAVIYGFSFVTFFLFCVFLGIFYDVLKQYNDDEK
jgi:hypothetical protein